MLKVYDNPCENCLLSENRIVNSKRAKDIIKDCVDSNTYFICHKSSMNNGKVCCKTFFDNFSDKVSILKMSKMANYFETINQQENNIKLTAYKDFNKSTK